MQTDAAIVSLTLRCAPANYLKFNQTNAQRANGMLVAYYNTSKVETFGKIKNAQISIL